MSPDMALDNLKPSKDRDREMKEGRIERRGERGRKKHGRKGRKPSTVKASFGWRRGSTESTGQ